MNQNNPLFSDPHKPFSELFDLLPKMTTGRIKNSDGYTFICNSDILHATHQHLSNTSFIINEGIKSIGGLLGVVDARELQDEAINDIGWFLRLMADLRGSADQLRDEIDYALEIRDKK